MPENRGMSIGAYKWTGALGAIALMAIAVVSFVGRRTSVLGQPGPILALTIVFTVAMAWNVAFQLLAYLRSDEFIREKHKSTWLWGGLVGLVVSMPLFMFFALGGLHWLDPSIPVDRDQLVAFARGYTLPVAAQALGAAVAMVLWNRAKR